MGRMGPSDPDGLFGRTPSRFQPRRPWSERRSPLPSPAAAAPPRAAVPPPRSRSRLVPGTRRDPPAGAGPPPGAPAARRATRAPRPLRSRSHDLGDLAEDAVDEAAGLLSRECLRQLDRLVDRRADGYVPGDPDLVDRDTQDDSVDAAHLLWPPVGRGLANDLVELGPVREDAADQVAGEDRKRAPLRLLRG